MAKDWRRFIPRFRRQARRTLRNPQKLAGVVRKAYGKSEKHQGTLKAVLDDLQTMLRLVRSWMSGDYREVSRTTLIAIVGAIAYFLSPIDGVFDAIPLLGLLDDAAVIGLVVAEVRGELDAFRAWEDETSSQELLETAEATKYLS